MPLSGIYCNTASLGASKCHLVAFIVIQRRGAPKCHLVAFIVRQRLEVHPSSTLLLYNVSRCTQVRLSSIYCNTASRGAPKFHLVAFIVIQRLEVHPSLT